MSEFFYSQSLKIRAIEKKLKLMEQKSDLDSFLFEPAAKKPNLSKSRTDTKADDVHRKTWPRLLVSRKIEIILSKLVSFRNEILRKNLCLIVHYVRQYGILD